MRMRLAQPTHGHTDELRRSPERLDVGAPAVAHAAPQTAHQLEDRVGYGPFIWYTRLYAFRNQFVLVELTFLEIAVCRALLHRRQRAHAADGLEAPSLEQEALAGRLVGAGEHRSHHDAVRPRGE